jgi:hypothetical protein
MPMMGWRHLIIEENHMNKLKYLSAFILIFMSMGYVYANDDNSESGQAINEGVQSSGHASASAAHSIAASGQVTSAVIAVPLSVGGAVLGSAGAVSAGAARDSMKAATTPIGTPLDITDETITVVPPNEALKPKDNK